MAPSKNVFDTPELGSAHNLCGAKSLGISKAGQIVLARLKEFQMWHQPTGSVVVGFRKGTMASVCLDARYLCVSQHDTGAFQAATPVPELRGSESE